MTRKFQLGKRSIRKIINMEENITMKAPFILSKKKREGGIPNKREMVKPFTTPVRGDKSKYRLFGIRSQL